jgi:hypothetical protein
MYSANDYILVFTYNDRNGKVLFLQDIEKNNISYLYRVVEHIWFITEENQKIFINNGQGSKALKIDIKLPISSFFKNQDEIYVGLKGVKTTYPFLLQE